MLPVFLPVSDEPGGDFLNVDDLWTLSECLKAQLKRSRPRDLPEAQWGKECKLNPAALPGFGAIRSNAYPMFVDTIASCGFVYEKPEHSR